LATTFTSREIDDFILHWERKFPLTVRRIYRYWDLLKSQNSGRLLARILHENNEATKDFKLNSQKVLKDHENRFDFYLAVMDRLNDLRTNNQIDEFLRQIDGPCPRDG
jgi:hypothetical protein